MSDQHASQDEPRPVPLPGRHFFRRTARDRAARLNLRARELDLQANVGARAEWLRLQGLPIWVRGFRVEKARRGPFMWEVVATVRPARRAP